MEEEKKRWSVTYTKHIKQKRKVYQDGFLDLHISTSKLMLYDDSEKLLECRMLRKDEVVSPAQTLSFSAYHVDVGLLHGSHFSSDAGTNSNKARPIDLSPSQKIIREFKKTELRKYGAPQTSPTTMKTSVTEWQVLYTTQLTQKSKRYHDGFLRVSVCGSLGRQVVLFDEHRKLLESSFLKRDVVIRSGESIPLDAHLVEIGECKGNDSSNDGKLGIRHEQKHQSESDGAFGKEWQVMYTTQVTQKAKKYHDGFLQLTNSGTLQRQIMLYDGSKKLINSRFLKKDEVIQSGESIAFDAHLVEIGEPEGNYQGLMDSDVRVSNSNIAGKTGLMHRVQNCLKTNKSFLKGQPQKSACAREYADPSYSISNIDETKLSENVSANKPLRDAIQILSILQKPIMQDSIATVSMDRNIMNPVPKEPQSSDSTRNIPECSQPQRVPIANHGSSEKLDKRESTECINIQKFPHLYPKAKSSCSGSKSPKNSEVGNTHETDSDNLESAVGCSSPIIHTCQETVDITKNSVEVKISREAGKCPSFKLGFD
ncbi:hypothetical protein SCA6_009791 [Theobroma cacao]